MYESHLKLRPLEREDLPAVTHLMSEHALWGERDRDEQRRHLERRLERGEFGLVVEQSGRAQRALAGFVLLSEGTFGDHGYIRLIGVRSRRTGEGIGTRLLHGAERLFVERGIERVFLLCTDWNTGAQAFYERHGYVRVGALPDWLRVGVSELIYVKRDLGGQGQ